MPLAAIHELFYKALTRQRSPLLSPISPDKLVYVSEDFFRSKSNCNIPDDVSKDSLGFFSVVLSYAKLARKLPIDTSTKTWIHIMPRTDFHTLHKLVEGSYNGELYDIVKILACYKNQGNQVE